MYVILLRYSSRAIRTAQPNASTTVGSDEHVSVPSFRAALMTSSLVVETFGSKAPVGISEEKILPSCRQLRNIRRTYTCSLFSVGCLSDFLSYGAMI